ncbi:MAG: YdcF family protein [Oscillospiraceae bacterium]|nr:YdcF family protein [Oscillospiraceae bacterium]
MIRLLRRIIGIIIIVAVIGFGALEVVVIAGAQDDIHGEPEVMVILGAQVLPSGPSVLLQDRLDTALDYLAEHPDMMVVVSGSQGDNEPMTEAASMRDYLVAHGIAEERIYLEDKSHNTSQNLQYTREVLTAEGYDLTQTELLVVSNGFHLARVRMLAARGGLDVSTLAAPSSHAGARVRSYLREAPALVKSFLFDW